MNRRGTNQHKNKYKHPVGLTTPNYIRVLWLLVFIAITIIVGRYMKENRKVLSPCPDSGCFILVKTVHASPLTETVRERIAVRTIREFGVQHVEEMDKLVFKESSFNPYAVNESSGACGLYQAFPCKKMKCAVGDVDCQISWGMTYVRERYGDPTQAWAFWQEHGWY